MKPMVFTIWLATLFIFWVAVIVSGSANAVVILVYALFGVASTALLALGLPRKRRAALRARQEQRRP